MKTLFTCPKCKKDNPVINEERHGVVVYTEHSFGKNKQYDITGEDEGGKYAESLFACGECDHDFTGETNQQLLEILY